MNSGIYKILNTVTLKMYIGSTENFSKRKYDHFLALNKNKHRNVKLQNAFNKYGCESLKFEILEEVKKFTNESDADFTIRLVNHREQHYLDTLLFAQEFIKSNKKDKRFNELGYNIRPLASSNKGIVRSKEANEKQSASMKGKAAWNKGLKIKIPNDQRDKMLLSLREKGAWNKGISMTQEAKIHLSELNKGKFPSNETRDKLKLAKEKNNQSPMLGKKQSDETKKLISKNCTGGRKSIISFDWLGYPKESFNSIKELMNKSAMSRSAIKRRISMGSEINGMYYQYL